MKKIHPILPTKPSTIDSPQRQHSSSVPLTNTSFSAHDSPHFLLQDLLPFMHSQMVQSPSFQKFWGWRNDETEFNFIRKTDCDFNISHSPSLCRSWRRWPGTLQTAVLRWWLPTRLQKACTKIDNGVKMSREIKRNNLITTVGHFCYQSSMKYPWPIRALKYM